MKSQDGRTIKVDGSLEDLYELVLKYCNLEPVKDVLRDYKTDDGSPEQKDIRISGANARQIVTENLQEAVSRGAIPIEAVYALLQEAEENGNQHIFFFRPKKTGLAALNNAEGIATRLLGANWRNAGFPRLRLQPMSFCWSDFRSTPDGGWIAKLYGHDTREEETDRKDEGVRARWVKLEIRDVRTVNLVRWRPRQGLLELRVAAARAKVLFDELKGRFQRGLDVDSFCEPWDLSKARQHLFNRAKDNVDLYECGDWLALDEESYALQGGPHLQDPDEKVHASPLTLKLVATVAASESLEKRRLVVHWKPNDKNGLKRSLRTILGTITNSHEVIISAQASSHAINDVVDQLLRFEN